VTKPARFAVAWTLFALVPALAGAGVRVEVGANGRRVIINENTVQRSRRLAGRLVPVPSADLEPLIQRQSDNQNLDPKLVKAVIQVESGYNHKALSNKGAMGLMQLMPDTASLFNVRNAFDPEENLRAGTRYLRQLLDRFAGRVELALAGYNAGPGAVEKHGGVPPYAETRGQRRSRCSERPRRPWRRFRSSPHGGRRPRPHHRSLGSPREPPQAPPHPGPEQPAPGHHLVQRLTVTCGLPFVRRWHRMPTGCRSTRR
jgi:transglycosylase-like protein with SLT domain